MEEHRRGTTRGVTPRLEKARHTTEDGTAEEARHTTEGGTAEEAEALRGSRGA